MLMSKSTFLCRNYHFLVKIEIWTRNWPFCVEIEIFVQIDIMTQISKFWPEFDIFKPKLAFFFIEIDSSKLNTKFRPEFDFFVSKLKFLS